jgi:hypothetical protein
VTSTRHVLVAAVAAAAAWSPGAAVRDPAGPHRMLPIYDYGDHLHPDDLGYAAMADLVDLSQL